MYIEAPPVKVAAKKELRDFSPRANYTDRATAVCRRRWCQLFRREGCFLDRSGYFFFQVAPELYLRG
jgi:hypothetical protein